jgi:hypothetical protein
MENVWQIRDDGNFRLPTILFIADFLDPNFSDSHEIRTLASKDSTFILDGS